MFRTFKVSKIHSLSTYTLAVRIILLTALPMFGFSQERFSLSGHLRDESSGEALIHATIYIKELK